MKAVLKEGCVGEDYDADDDNGDADCDDMATMP